MAKARTLVGLGAHAAKVVAAVLDAETGELRFQRLGGESEPVVRLLSSLEGPVRASYEAGPTGYGLARALDRAGVECVVAAPGKIPRGATERVKTDRRDAEHLVRLLLAGKLHPVRVPGPAEEALRDLVRARDDVRIDLMRARHRLSKLLLRHDVRFPGRAWTERHRAWLARVELGEEAAQATLVGLPRRGRGAAAPQGRARAPDRRGGADCAMGRAGRQAALPARRRHPDRRRPLL
jgi:transposase